MSSDDDIIVILTHLFAGPRPADEANPRDASQLAAALSEVLDGPSAHAPSLAPVETLAALVDGGLGPRAASTLLRSAADRARAEASMAFVEEMRDDRVMAPPHLIGAVRAQLTAAGAKVVPFQRRPIAQPAVEIFQLLAAASGSADQAIICHSESGLLTLRTFPGMSAADRAAGRCSLLVTIDPERAAVYEGLTLRAFVTIKGEEKVLAEETVTDGAVFAEISLLGIDLVSRDPVSVVFSTARPPD